VKNTSINISGKLNTGLVELYDNVMTVADKLGIQVLVVGAMARDLVLAHGYGATIQRGTRDVDFGINVASWDDFSELKDELIRAGFRADPEMPHRLEMTDTEGLSWEIDIIPFGEIADSNQEISWPPGDDVVMSVLGFEEALAHSIEVKIHETPNVVILVASPASMALLKLISWVERDSHKKLKDAQDFDYIIKSYSKIPEVHDALYEEGHMAAVGWDEDLASARKLGGDCSQIAKEDAVKFLAKNLFDDADRVEQLASEMLGRGGSLGNNRLKEFIASFRAQASECVNED
jgi:predicted nucleotidyltransferase